VVARITDRDLKMNQIEPHSYLTGFLTAIVNGHKQKHIDHLLPWSYAN